MRALALGLVLLVAGQQPTMIAPEQAAQHVGETVVVKGVVSRVHTMASSSTTFIDFGPQYPNQTFTAVIFAKSQSRFPGVDKLVGNTVLVKGTVQLYKGKPEIVLEYAEQLQVVS